MVVGCATWMDGSVRNIAAIAKRGRVEGKEPCGKELCEGSLLFQRKDQVGHATEAKATRRSPASIILCCQRETRRIVERLQSRRTWCCLGRCDPVTSSPAAAHIEPTCELLSTACNNAEVSRALTPAKASPHQPHGSDRI